MTAVVVGSVRGAPGVTTVSLLMASCMDGAVAEADLDGGVLAARYRLGREPGLTTWAAARSRGPDEWREHAQHAGGVPGIPVLVGPDDPQRASGLWATAGDVLAGSLAASSTRIVVDAGRIRPDAGHAALLSSVPLVVMLVRPVLDDLLGLAHRLKPLAEMRAKVAVALVGTGAYGPDDVARQFRELDVLAVLPRDKKASAVMDRGGTAHSLARTGLARAVRSLTEEVVGRIGVPGSGRRELMASSEQRRAPV